MLAMTGHPAPRFCPRYKTQFRKLGHIECSGVDMRKHPPAERHRAARQSLISRSRTPAISAAQPRVSRGRDGRTTHLDFCGHHYTEHRDDAVGGSRISSAGPARPGQSRLNTRRPGNANHRRDHRTTVRRSKTTPTHSMSSPGQASQQPPGGRLFGLSTPCGRAGTSSWPRVRGDAGQTAPGSVPSPPGRQEPQHPARALARADRVEFWHGRCPSAGGAA